MPYCGNNNKYNKSRAFQLAPQLAVILNLGKLGKFNNALKSFVVKGFINFD